MVFLKGFEFEDCVFLMLSLPEGIGFSQSCGGSGAQPRGGGADSRLQRAMAVGTLVCLPVKRRQRGESCTEGGQFPAMESGADSRSLAEILWPKKGRKQASG